MSQTVVSQYNIGRLIFRIKGSRCSPLIFYMYINISPHLYRWSSRYGSHILHSLPNKHDVHMHGEAEEGSQRFLMAVSMVRSRWHWDSHETFSSRLLSATSSKYLPTYAVSHPGFVVVTKGVWHLSVGLGHGLAMGDSRRHPPTGTHGRSGQGRGQKSHPFPTISPGTTRSDLATELKPWMLETDKISL